MLMACIKIKMSKGYLIMDSLVALLLLSLYIPLFTQSALTIGLSINRVIDYHYSLIHLKAHINDPNIPFDAKVLDYKTKTISMFFTTFSTQKIFWVHIQQ